MALLHVKELNKYNGDDLVVNTVSFSQQPAQKIAIAGETGSGKSTLLKMIAGLIQLDGGQILFDDKKVLGPEEKLVAGHAEIAYLSQHFELPKSLRVEQVLTYANSLTEEEADLLYEVCDITHLLTRRTDQLSGGEKQRVALARLLSISPRLLLLDEPFSNLDRVHKNILQSVVTSIGEQLEITIILVSHDPADTLSWADEIIVMKQGTIVQQGTPASIYHHPVSEYVAGLFGKYNIVNEKQANTLGRSTGLLLRPEDLTLASAGLNGEVIRSLFYGNHYEAEIDCDGSKFFVRVDQNVVSPGEIVCVSLSPAYIAGIY